MEKGWVCIFTTDRLHMAEIARQILSDHDIQSVIVNKKDSNYLFGFIEIYVQEENALTGKYHLKDMDKTDNRPNNP